MSQYLARKFIVAGGMVLVVAAIQVARGWHRVKQTLPDLEPWWRNRTL